MGFRDDDGFQLVGSRREQIKQLGNGVCPPVMAAIVKHLTNGKTPLKDNRPTTKTTRPEPRKVTSIKYQKRKGEKRVARISKARSRNGVLA